MTSPIENENVFDSINEKISNLFISSDMSDCEFKFSNGEKIKGHKNILGVSSPVFKAMLFGDLKNTDSVQTIDDIEPDIFLKMMKFIYTDNVEFDSVENACGVYTVANKYILPTLKKHCEEYILLNVKITTVFYLLDFVKVYENVNIKQECLNLIRSETNSVLNNEHFLQVDVHILKTIVEQPALNINSELDLFVAIEKWAKNKSEEQEVAVSEVRPSIDDVINNVRFLAMKNDEFATGPGLSDILTQDERLQLSLNIHSYGVCSIPKNLCSLRKPRPPRIKYQYTYASITNLTSAGINSTEFLVKNMSWRLHVVGKLQANSVYTHVVLYLVFVGDSKNTAATCTASVELKYLPQKKGYQPFKTCFRQTFNRGENSWSHPLALEWSEASGKNSIYLKDGSITVEVSVEPDAEPEDNEAVWK